MRVNVYTQELTKEFEIVNTTSDTGIVYYGLRYYLHSSDMLHHTDDDDDRSAITFWIPNAKSFSPRDFSALLVEMGVSVSQIADLIEHDENAGQK